MHSADRGRSEAAVSLSSGIPPRSSSVVRRFLIRPSFVIGSFTALCALPVFAEIVHRYVVDGTLHKASVAELSVVPLIYFIVRYAERQMQSEGRSVSDREQARSEQYRPK